MPEPKLLLLPYPNLAHEQSFSPRRVDGDTELHLPDRKAKHLETVVVWVRGGLEMRVRRNGMWVVEEEDEEIVRCQEEK